MMIGDTALKAVNEKENVWKEHAEKVWNFAETAYKEVNTSAATAELLKSLGFKVETGVYGMPTALRAEWGSGKPVIGFLGELDALPGLSQKVGTVKEPVKAGAAGHGCGHNLLCTVPLAAAYGLKEELKASGRPGTVVYYGCPAEEALTGKVFMARGGAFRELDIAFSWHGASKNQTSYGTMTGMNSAIFRFTGRTSHAGGSPEKGRSALDAVEIMDVGANYLREHVTMDNRIHYVIVDGGMAPNIVPDHAAVWYFVRALTREAVEDTYRRLVLCAEGAAHMTETKLDIEFLGGCYPTLENHVLTDLLQQGLKDIKGPVWTKEELDFADKLNRDNDGYEELKKDPDYDGPLSAHVSPIFTGYIYGSTDVGDVQHICPCSELNTAAWNAAAPGHSWQITSCVGMSIGEKGMMYGARVLALTAARAAADPKIIEAAKAEFARSTGGKAYSCPIPAEVPVPMPEKE
jgi:aminobenzoyl-glutamate utilization protein B